MIIIEGQRIKLAAAVFDFCGAVDKYLFVNEVGINFYPQQDSDRHFPEGYCMYHRLKRAASIYKQLFNQHNSNSGSSTNSLHKLVNGVCSHSII